MALCFTCGNEIGTKKSCPFCGEKQPESMVGNSSPKYKVLNIKKNMPSTQDSRLYLKRELIKMQQEGVRYVKIIHGYGSSGVGGEIRYAIRDYLDTLKWERILEFWVIGENFNLKDKSSKRLLHIYPKIKSDRDINRRNKGITILVLK